MRRVRKMQENYQQVPNIITGKDLDYLSDMFTWNLGAYKKLSNCIEQVQTEDIRSTIQSAIDLFHNHVQEILNILNQGGSNE